MSQKLVNNNLENVQEDHWENRVTVNLEAGKFAAVTSNALSEGGDQREITVSVMPLDDAEGGKCDVVSGTFVRREGEKSVKVKLVDEQGKEIDSQEVKYS